MVVGYKDKRTEERKRRKTFWKVAFFFLSSCFVCFHMVKGVVKLRCGDFGPKAVAG